MSIFSRLNSSKVLVVAELSANHGHRLDIALATIRAAKEAGADAIKIQTYTADTITLDCDNEYFQISSGTLWDGTTLYKLYKEAFTPWEWHKTLQDEARSAGLEFFSTPFDPSAVDFLDELDVPYFKIASFEITDTPLIEYAASKGKPMIISTGIATLGEIGEAVQACRKRGNDDITLLKCTSEYPSLPEAVNLLTMANMQETFGVEVGLSDHSMGPAVAIAAVALGARVIEKHFILDRSIGGADATFSMEPNDFRLMVDQIRTVEKALGQVSYDVLPEAIPNRVFSRSLFVVKDVKLGEELSAANVRSIRPGLGLPPKHLDSIWGKKARAFIKRGTPLKWDLFE